MPQERPRARPRAPHRSVSAPSWVPALPPFTDEDTPQAATRWRFSASWPILPHLAAILAPSCAIVGHIGSSWATLGHIGPSWAILGHLGPYWAILSRIGPYWVIFGPYRTIWGHIGSYLDHSRPHMYMPLPYGTWARVGPGSRKILEFLRQS